MTILRGKGGVDDAEVGVSRHSYRGQTSSHIIYLCVVRLWSDARFSDLQMCGITDGDVEDMASCFDNAGRATIQAV